MNCTNCGTFNNQGARFCSSCGGTLTGAPSNPFAGVVGTLQRPREGRMIAGVCAAFANQYGWDVTIVRLVVALVVFFGAGSPLVAYIIGWVVIPEAPLVVPVVAVPVASAENTQGPIAS